MIRWMRRISPAFEAAFIGGFVGPFAMLLLHSQRALLPDDELDAELKWMLISGYCLVGGLAYGVKRARMFHPQSNEDVRQWLAMTPWHWPQPLPFGPVRLALQDVVAVLIATAWMTVVTESLWPPIAFSVYLLISYTCTLAGIAETSGVRGIQFGVGITLAAAVAFAITPWLAAVFLGCSYVISWWGNGQSLRRFHEWSNQLETDERIPPDWLATGGKSKGSLGWPYAALNPQRSGPRVSLREATESSLLVGMWTWAVFHLIVTAIAVIPVEEMDFSAVQVPRSFLYGFPVMFGAVLAIGRLLCYGSELTPPLSIWGRLVNRRFLLPGYDRVWIVPISLFALGPVMTMIGSSLSVPLELFLPASLATLTLLALGAGPTLEQWRLTADGHIRPCSFSKHGDLIVTQ